MKKFLKSKKVLVAAALATIMAIGGATYAWFSYTAEVAGGSATMAEVSIETTPMVWYDEVWADPIDLDAQGITPSTDQSNYNIGYSVTNTGNVSAIVRLDVASAANVNFYAEPVLDAKGNAVFNKDANDDYILNRTESLDSLQAYHGNLGEPSINIEKFADLVPFDGTNLNNGVLYYYDAVEGILLAEIEPGATADAKFVLNFPDELDNRYQRAEVVFAGGDVVASQADNKAVDSVIFKDGSYSLVDAFDNGTIEILVNK